MDDLLIHGDSIDVLNSMPDFKADLAIIDPPYFKVVNESLDYQWRTEHLHPTQKPQKLITRLVATSSNENDLVLDPFSGVGTTAVCCEQLNRRYLCIEKEEKYHRVAEERVKNVLENF